MAICPCSQGQWQTQARSRSHRRQAGAIKGEAALSAYTHDLRWFRKHCRKHCASRLNRDDAIAPFAAGRDEGLNQESVNKRVIVAGQSHERSGIEVDAASGLILAEEMWCVFGKAA